MNILSPQVSLPSNLSNFAIGFDDIEKKDVKITAEGSTLKVVATYADDLPKDADYLHRGISRKSVHREFALADEIKVIGAQMDSGMLTIRLEKVIPEHKKPKQIEVK
jgi:molecular chaperone IbpA